MTRTKYFKDPNSGTYATIYFLKIVLPMQPHYVPLSKMDTYQAIFREITQTHRRKKISSNQLFSNI